MWPSLLSHSWHTHTTHCLILCLFPFFLLSLQLSFFKLFPYILIFFAKKQTMNTSSCLLYMMCKLVELPFQQLKVESHLCAKIKTSPSPILCGCMHVSLLLHLLLESCFVGDVGTTMDLPSKKHHHHGVFKGMITEAKGQPNELVAQDL